MPSIISIRQTVKKFSIMDKVHIVIRCEEHDDYVEAVFKNKKDTLAHCNKYGEKDYYHYIETMEVI